jgi:hypothetical protein
MSSAGSQAGEALDFPISVLRLRNKTAQCNLREFRDNYVQMGLTRASGEWIHVAVVR